MTRGLERFADNKRLNGVLIAIQADDCLTPTDMALFYAIMICYHQDGQGDFFQVSRSGLMSISKISSTRTYHKCIQKLINLGYILYTPSYHPKLGSKISWAVVED